MRKIELSCDTRMLNLGERILTSGTNGHRVVVVPYWSALVSGPERSIVLAGGPILHPENTGFQNSNEKISPN